MLIRYAFRKSARRPAPRAISVSGERTRRQDYYSAHVYLDNGHGEAVVCKVDGVTETSVQVRQWDETTAQFAIEREVPFDAVEGRRVDITHDYEGHQFGYRSPGVFFWYEFFRIYFIAVIFERLQQVLFNEKMLIRQERVDVLRQLLTRSERGRDIGMTVLAYQVDVHGVRFLRHPEYDKSSVHYRRIFDSLVESGDLRKDQAGLNYWVTPRALITLAAYETEERKHRDMLRPQKWMVWLTLLLLFGTGAQAYVAYMQFQRDLEKDRVSRDGRPGARNQSPGADSTSSPNGRVQPQVSAQQ